MHHSGTAHVRQTKFKTPDGVLHSSETRQDVAKLLTCAPSQ